MKLSQLLERKEHMINDNELIEYLVLKSQVQFKMDKDYLKNFIGLYLQEKWRDGERNH